MKTALTFSLLSTLLIVTGSMLKLLMPGYSLLHDGLLVTGLLCLVLALLTLSYKDFLGGAAG
ncbi:hypothetical protein [Lewinella sp. IMCC34191]|uniref:hypothetical protein n=1 Tax=Lewinella sp. IMCC34191 TaxID=2259172 RepID=UPI000E235CDF|nr:hypothetical protein [Lewinella sp. IMCC34191]